MHTNSTLIIDSTKSFVSARKSRPWISKGGFETKGYCKPI